MACSFSESEHRPLQYQMLKSAMRAAPGSRKSPPMAPSAILAEIQRQNPAVAIQAVKLRDHYFAVQLASMCRAAGGFCLERTVTKKESLYVLDHQWSATGTWFLLPRNITYENGKICKAEGDHYFFEDGKLNGQGKVIHTNSTIYEGCFKDGKPSGPGKKTLANGDIHEGCFKDSLLSGQGKMTFATGDIYEGCFKDSKLDGPGKKTLANGDIHEGCFKDSLLSGQSKVTFATGTIEEGCFKDNKLDGQGKRSYATGTIEEGCFKDNKLDGQGKRSYANGKIYEGCFKDGKLSGPSKRSGVDGPTGPGGGGKRQKSSQVQKVHNYYVVATVFFNSLCPLTGSTQKKALGKDGVNAWGANKGALKEWFVANDLDLTKKLEMSDIRTTIAEKNLIKVFEDHFSELAAAIKAAKPPAAVWCEKVVSASDVVDQHRLAAELAGEMIVIDH
jgi:hypothetical protein